MIKFYYSTAPNPMKVALCLEEMGLSYDPIAVDTRKGEQFAPEQMTVMTRDATGLLNAARVRRARPRPGRRGPRVRRST